MRIPFPINYPEMVVEKSDGLTTSERKLAILGNHTFLRLWSYPNPYKMQLEGKELCDLLIVFDNHIIIFSDKDCKYGKSGNSLVDWRRWYKRAIQKSAEQLIGARNWILRHPDRIAIDAKCSKRLPLEIKSTPQTKFHLVAIAHGTEEPCKAYFSGGDGGLLINNRIVGDMHINEKCEPFSIGQVFSNPEDFIHVFDDSSYINVLTELDTIQDFIGYLNARQTLLTQKQVIAESENSILAQHLRGVMKGYNNFLQEIHKEYTGIYFKEGLLQELRQSKQYLDWRSKLNTSYFWDELLQKTFFFIENGMSESTTSPTIQEQSELFKQMAREDRFHRYCLSEGFLSFLLKAKPGDRGTRILFNSCEQDNCYLLFLLPRADYMSDAGYRSVRKKMLMDYCRIIKSEYPKISHIIGVAHETSDGDYSSEDFVYFDASNWSEKDQSEALFLKRDYEEHNLLSKRSMVEKHFYPEPPKMKGRDRNKPCPCGSGRKFKNCCGRN